VAELCETAARFVARSTRPHSYPNSLRLIDHIGDVKAPQAADRPFRNGAIVALHDAALTVADALRPRCNGARLLSRQMGSLVPRTENDSSSAWSYRKNFFHRGERDIRLESRRSEQY
jgi:hypothetical protein